VLWAILGVVLASAGTHILAHLDAIGIPLLAHVRIDVPVLAFCLLAALLTGVVFGLAPALQVPANTLHDALKDSTRGSTAGTGRNWIRSALVVSEIAFACVLLVGAGLLVRSFLRVLDVNLGFRPEHAAALRVDPDASYSNQAQQNTYFDEVLRRVRAIPGIAAAGLTDALRWGVTAVGARRLRAGIPAGKVPQRVCARRKRWLPESHGHRAHRRARYLGKRHTFGRTRDRHQPDHGAYLMARADAIGQTMRACGERHVVGVVGDVRHLALEQSSGMEMYLPMRQCRDISSVDLVIRTSLDPAELAASVRAALKPIAPTFPEKTSEHCSNWWIKPSRPGVSWCSCSADSRSSRCSSRRSESTAWSRTG